MGRVDQQSLRCHVVRVTEPGRTPLHVVVVGRLEIGRSGSGLLLGDPGISRCHLVVEAVGDHLVVSDPGSTNGSTIDGETLTAARRLEPGRVVRFAGCSLELAVMGPAGPTPATGPDGRATSIDVVAAAALDDKAAAAEHDVGTVTIVFTDIEGSTARAVELGDVRWMEALGAHNALVRSRLARHGGREVKSQGDGFMLSFPSARRALACMIDVQRTLAAYGRSHPLEAMRVRVGLHTGEVIVGDDGDLFGRHVVIAARIANVASGGEILASSLVREIVEARGDVVFGVPRPVTLKGISGTQLAHPVQWQDEAERVPIPPEEF
jgi:adenylate cyclase